MCLVLQLRFCNSGFASLGLPLWFCNSGFASQISKGCDSIQRLDFVFLTFQALESVKNNKATYEKTAKDTKVKHIAQKDEMMKVVGDRIKKILEEKIQEIDKVYDAACQSLYTQSERISNYLQKVGELLQRTNDVLQNSKLEELLTAQK